MAKPARQCEQTTAGDPVTRRRRASRTKLIQLLLTVLGASLGLLAFHPKAPAFIWNFTESLSIGLYRIDPAAPVRGDVVVIAPAGRQRAILDEYGILPTGRLLMKQVAALPGDVVCRAGAVVTINGAPAARALPRTHSGRALPVWAGCQALGRHELLPLAPHPLSFDGRYFGPINGAQIVGVARPVFTLSPLPGAM